MPYVDVVNISVNQVVVRSVITSMSSVLPVISLLLVGSGLLGAVTLREFALALLVGMLAGVYSSIFIASPMLATLKARTGRTSHRERLTGDRLRAAVIGAGFTGRVEAAPEPQPAVVGATHDGSDTDDGSLVQPADRLLTHPPRPRKKKRR